MSDDAWILAFQQALKSLTLPTDLDAAAVHRLAQRGMLTELLADGSPAAIAVMRDAVVSAALPPIRQEALDGLIHLAQSDNPTAIDSLYLLAIDDEHAGAINAISAYRFKPKDSRLAAIFSFLYHPYSDYAQTDPDCSLLSEFVYSSPLFARRASLRPTIDHPQKIRLANLLEALLNVAPEQAAWLLREFPRFNRLEKNLTVERLIVLADQRSAQAQDLLCRLAFLHDHPKTRHVSIEHGYLPMDTPSQAAFLFLTEQWQAYENLDFSHQWLIAAYEAGEPALKQRLLNHARSTGHIHWLHNLSRVRTSLNLKDLTAHDWHTILDKLPINPQSDQVQRLLHHAPAYWCAQILQKLSVETNADSLSEGDLAELVHAAQLCFRQGPEIHPVRFLQSPQPGISAFGLSPDNNELAVGGSDSSLHFWNFKSRYWQAELISPFANFRAVAYSPDGEFIAAASGDHNIRIYRVKDRLLLKTLTGHNAQVKSLIFQSDGRMLYSAGLDGFIFAWRFPTGSLAYPPVDTGAELFSMALTKDDLLISGGTGKICQVRDPNSGKLIRSFSGFGDTILALAANTEQWLAVATRIKQLHLINTSSGKPVHPAIEGSESASQLLFHPVLNWLVAMDLRGTIALQKVPTLTEQNEVRRHTQPGSGLAFTSDFQTLISASLDGKIVFWDFTTINLAYQTGSGETHKNMTTIEEIVHASSSSPLNHRWLQFMLALLRWRARYDILIGEPQMLQVGEFDILL